MEQSYLMPGQERWESFRDANGVPKVRYSYCSLKGRLFRCVSWLVGQDRCYRN